MIKEHNIKKSNNKTEENMDKGILYFLWGKTF